jgi:hypothetical protein
MYDAVFVLVEAFNKILKKKPDTFRTNIRRGVVYNNGSKGLDCNMSQVWVTPWEHGDKISRHLRKVRFIQFLKYLAMEQEDVATVTYSDSSGVTF